jgi:hypothetical protein
MTQLPSRNRIRTWAAVGTLGFLTYLAPQHPAAALLPERQSAISQRPPSEEVRANSIKVRKELVSFLSIWLLKKDTKSSLRFFADSAFSNQAMLSADCAGYMKEINRLSRKGFEAGLRQFLADFEKGVAGNSLDEILVPKGLADVEINDGKSVLNDPMNDGFMLVHIGQSETSGLPGSAQSQAFLKKNFPASGYYAAVVPIHDGFVYFLWIEDKGNWRIYHADLVCQ